MTILRIYYLNISLVLDKVIALQCLLVLVEKWKKSLDKGGKCGAVLTDLSKAFDCLLHDLLIAKLHAYGFEIDSLRLIYSYLVERKQRVKIDNEYSSWQEILFGVPQGSILGPLLFNIHMCDLFFAVKSIDIASYADDTTPYVSLEDTDLIIEKLEVKTNEILQWFDENAMKANADKCHLLITTNEEKHISIGGQKIQNSKSEKLLGVTIDNKLSFTEHVRKICDKASQKLNALARLSSFMSLEKRRLIMKAFVNSQFGYCPLIWMFHNRTLNNRINRIHERALRIVYQDKKSSFNELLRRDNTVTVHQRNLQVLATELYKVKMGLAPQLVKEIFPLSTQAYNLRSTYEFKLENVKTVHYGTESLSFLGPKIWELVPLEIKSSQSLEDFKQKIKSWIPENCPCRLCKTYLPQIGFI